MDDGQRSAMLSMARHVEEFWQHVDDGELRLQWCHSCDRFQHHPRPVCRTCLGDDLTFRPIAAEGALYSWTVATAEFGSELVGKAPYAFGIVELDAQPGLKMVVGLDLADADRFRVGARTTLEIGPVVLRDKALVARLEAVE